MSSPADPNWTLVIHGGAGSMARDHMSQAEDAGARAGLSAALDAGAAILGDGGSALDAVEAAVKVLEDDPHFNAGRGSVFTYEGANEMDAAIMNGMDRAAGAVARTTATRNPISLARRVMTDSPHVLLGSEGADLFSREQGLEQADPAWFATPERLRQLEELKRRPDGAFDIAMKYGTVGAVACDSQGHVAAATSTGGLTGKRWGRVGDTPLIGAGTYADDRSCAVSATGAGEYFIRIGIAHEIAARVRLAGEAPAVATQAVFAELAAMGGVGGVITAAPGGEGGWHFNTAAMYRGMAKGDGTRRIAIYGDEG
ncbi:isoaspartyl peptidase/L-asparaginase family protein [Sphingobium algorifonticola]|uniref:Isoaspartyl peptidase n=1 Tax=Sphingobium algorifonticola TaxID=2008318 RepID=A0A437JDD6_9SPHN|nr:isoaspartyl peptidase/L-asparaginase [Sphingobium algorifonticola]RVT43925.1 isoaspartyl peptidase/L-asparaginase [Sphingobium algorifonticola]